MKQRKEQQSKCSSSSSAALAAATATAACNVRRRRLLTKTRIEGGQKERSCKHEEERSNKCRSKFIIIYEKYYQKKNKGEKTLSLCGACSFFLRVSFFTRFSLRRVYSYYQKYLHLPLQQLGDKRTK